jgi:hypothetical protein
VVESLMAGIARVSQAGIGLGKCAGVFQSDRAVQFLEWLLGHRSYHVWKGDVVFGRMSEPEAIECAVEISKFVGCKFPISILPGLPRAARAAVGIVAIIRSLMLGRYPVG